MSIVEKAIERAKLTANGKPVTEAILNEALKIENAYAAASANPPAVAPLVPAPSLAQKIETAVETALGIK